MYLSFGQLAKTAYTYIILKSRFSSNSGNKKPTLNPRK
jgi:hypothetical protein